MRGDSAAPDLSAEVSTKAKWFRRIRQLSEEVIIFLQNAFALNSEYATTINFHSLYKLHSKRSTF